MIFLLFYTHESSGESRNPSIADVSRMDSKVNMVVRLHHSVFLRVFLVKFQSNPMTFEVVFDFSFDIFPLEKWSFLLKP